MQKNKKRDTNDSSIKLILSVGGEQTEISALDLRKFELINYYMQQNKSERNDFFSTITQRLAKEFESAIESEYKKRVPRSVREMYEGLLTKSAVFGGEEESEPNKAAAEPTVNAEKAESISGERVESISTEKAKPNDDT
ncbi:hypothetical protein SAMN02910447_03312 [Ruminococcus sp. YE71]|uniref:hypothetical protein n=1 Tax=unclassified Ruminococcus TaxID=2608920 RepID=UPI000881630C|nr:MULTISPECIES: hypothetical protein [unclassified Ruminococcus]SDA31026.1 hypothetical protein SAMN02910446_03381 [Ruminococcus sp. YE78]SFW50884.1 hypothetical protein SAMN02910447_03312 [Ruminococcus sp. YE71]